ncbi:Pantothenate transporter liz1 [Cladophialophora carrionii]|uniref:Pantothenate transporter liz1 n=1 Tax=Cladophialophora carrionii TaxID=86049 RepID=A0A1C1CNH5_9EURO|nr:Pantothenate transporter liz1 [Cladophialophora carrionii]
MAFHGDSKVVDVKGFEAEPQSIVKATTRSEEDLSDPIQAKPKRKWQSYIWDTLDKSPEERRLLFKLDAAVLTFATLGYFIKYLDQININNAFVSGMKEDLGLYKNQLNYMQTCWTVGYVIGEYIIGSWYRRDELAKRSCIFHTASAIGSMFSGYLMAAVYHLGGKGGYRGWQWLFIVDGIISLPIAISGFFLLPDVPEITRAWYFTPEERLFAQKRMQLEGRAQRAPYTKAKFKRIFTSWHIYALATLYMTFNNAGSGVGQPTFAQYLKDSDNPKYTVGQINTYPTTTYAVQIVSTLAYAWTSDSVFRGARWPPIVFGGVVSIIAYASLAVWDIPTGWHWACYIIAGCGGGLSGLCMAWAHEICSDDNEERAIVVGTMNELAYVFQAWLPLVVWQQVDAPRYHKGFVTSACLAAGMIITSLVIRVLWKRELAKKAKMGAIA